MKEGGRERGGKKGGKKGGKEGGKVLCRTSGNVPQYIHVHVHVYTCTCTTWKTSTYSCSFSLTLPVPLFVLRKDLVFFTFSSEGRESHTHFTPLHSVHTMHCMYTCTCLPTCTVHVHTSVGNWQSPVAQATCKRSVATYFDQLVAIPGDLHICSRTLRYSHTTTHIARPYTFR